MTKAEETKAAKKKSRRNLIVGSSVIGVFAIASIGGTVYYGSVVLPEQDHQKNVKACEIFNEGVIKAQTSPDIVTFFTVIFETANQATKAAADHGKLVQDMSKLAMLEYQLDPNIGLPALQVVEQGAATIQDECGPVLGVK